MPDSRFIGFFADGGIEPSWPRRGNEIFYIGPENRMTTVEVKTGGTFEAGVPRPLFSTRPSGVVRYDTLDGRRFLVSVPTDGGTSIPATVVSNWFEELKRRSPSRD